MLYPVYQVSAINDALTSENRIHSDDIARKYGFTGALVSGVSIFGYLTHPLVATQGEDWFSNTIAEVTFLKPAYAGELLDIRLASEHGDQPDHLQVSANNPEGTLLARLNSRSCSELPAVDALADSETVSSQATRPEIHWDLIETGKGAPRYEFLVSAERQQEALSLMRDELGLYQQGSESLIHPYLLLKECNNSLMRMFVLPAWIHVGSRLLLREPVRVGEPLEIVTVPVEKWQRKGHQFVRLYIAFRTASGVALEVWHTAIFKLADS